MRSMTFVVALLGLPVLAACTVNNPPAEKPTTVVTQPQPSTVVTPPPRTTVVTPSY